MHGAMPTILASSRCIGLMVFRGTPRRTNFRPHVIQECGVGREDTKWMTIFFHEGGILGSIACVQCKTEELKRYQVPKHQQIQIGGEVFVDFNIKLVSITSSGIPSCA